MSNRLMSLGAALSFLAVAFGAFGTHALKAVLSDSSLAIWQTAVQYQMAHGLAILLVGLVYGLTGIPRIKTAAILLAVGVVNFSGSLYILAVTGFKILGAITPLGGLALLSGWLIFSLAILKGPELTPDQE